MSKKNKPMRAKLIDNPGAGNILESAARIEQVRGSVITGRGHCVDFEKEEHGDE